PRTHALKQLLDSYGQATDRARETDEFLDDHIDVISNLENAYITARYLPGDFRKKEIENMSGWVDRLWTFLEGESS
ncbi:MAG: HEPN domain-containing protein, partial [Bradymonadaceae bacterium]